MPRFQYAGLELISQFILSERWGPSPFSDASIILYTFDIPIIDTLS